jgi:DNA modification methylase
MTLEVNKFWQINCLTWMQEQDSGIVDLTVTSPPYDDLRTYNGYSFDFEAIAYELARITKKGGVIVWVVGDGTVKGSETGTSFRQALFFKDKCKLNLHDTMIYQKNTSSFASGTKSNRYTQIFEYMFVFSKGKPKTANLFRDKPNKWGGWSTWGQASKRLPDGTFQNIGVGRKEIKEFGVRNNIFRYVCSGGFGQSDKLAYKHPATFPEKLAEDHILTWSNPGDLVFDPFAGSGTTLLMAHKHNRDFVGTEMSAEYYELIKQRFANAANPKFKKPKVEAERVCQHCCGEGYVSAVEPKELLKKKRKQKDTEAIPTVTATNAYVDTVPTVIDDFTSDVKIGNAPLPPEMTQTESL